MELLNDYRSNTTSQFGENGIVSYLLDGYPRVPPVCLEVGAGDGVRMSNTHTLWAKQGWRALLIELDTATLKERFAHLANVTIVEQAIAASGLWTL